MKPGSPPQPRTSTLVFALLAGLLLRLFFLYRYAHIQGDSLLYGDIAHNLLRHGIYGITNGSGTIRPTLIRLPGYPLFLAFCFRLFGLDAHGQERYYPALALQILFDLLACVLLSRLAGRLFGPRAGIAALWLAALCPFTANYTVAPLTETLTLFSITLAFFSLERWTTSFTLTRRALNPWLYLLAFALAYSILLRPEQGLLAAAILPCVLYLTQSSRGCVAEQIRVPQVSPLRPGSSRGNTLAIRRLLPTSSSLFPAVLLACLTLLPLVPWAIRNHQTFHVFEPLAPRFANDPGESNPAGFQRWYRTWAIDFASTQTVYWNYDGADIDIATLPNRAFDSQSQYAATAALIATYNITDNNTPALDAAFNTLAIERIHANPIRYYVALPTARLLNMAFRPRADMLPIPLEWWRPLNHIDTFLFASFYATLNLAYFALAAFTLIRRRILWRPHAPLVYAMLATIALRSILLLTIDNSEPRYTLEFFPILILLAAAAFNPKPR